MIEFPIFPALLSSTSFSPRFIRAFTKHFAGQDVWHNQQQEPANLGYAWVHYALIRVLKPKRVLCIGSRYGFIPAICALACKHNRYGMVDFVDAGYDQGDPNDEKNHWGGVGFWKTSVGKKHFNRWGLSEYLKMQVMRTDRFFARNKARTWQYSHIDGDHSYQGVKYDFNQGWNSLSPLGMIAIHDVLTPDTTGNLEYGTRRFWSELTKSNKHTFMLPGVCGVGFVQKYEQA